MGKAVGIDLGTTFSAVAVIEGGKPEVITNAEGTRVANSKQPVRISGAARMRWQPMELGLQHFQVATGTLTAGFILSGEM